jgi:signal transduction histidine kinase
MIGPHQVKVRRRALELGLSTALEVREDPMFAAVDGTNQGWPGPDTVAATKEDAPPVDGAWRIWEMLRGWDKRFAIAVDATLAVGLFVLCSGWFLFSKVPHDDLWLVAVLTLPLVLRRRAPLAVFLVIAVVALVQWVTAGPLVADSALLAALFTVTTESDWIVVVIAGLVLEIGVIMATERWTPVGNYIKSLVFLTGMAAAALLAGIVVRTLRRQMGWLVERAHRLEFERDQQSFLAAAAERARIAREMHDVVSHNIQVMVTLADAAAVAQRTDPHRATEVMADVSGTGRQALRDMRRLLGLLRDGAEATDGGGARPLPADPFALAPQPGLTELDALAERVRSTGLEVKLQRAGQPFALSGAAELTVYRIVQEALTNALKHAASARSVHISLTFDDPDIRLHILDDGRSLAPALVRGGAASGQSGAGVGHGVLGMTERAAAFEGTLLAGPAESGGWEVVATLRGCKTPTLK